MIAAFLRDVDGGFNYPVAMFSLFLVFVGMWTAGATWTGIRTGRILDIRHRGTKSYGVWVEREKNRVNSGIWSCEIQFSYYL
jgi:hypothetical protein